MSKKRHKHAADPSAVAEKPEPVSAPIARPRKILFSILLVLIPFLILGLVEAGLRIFRYGDDTRLFITAADELPQYFRVNPKVARRFFYMQSVIPAAPKDLFLKTKPENGLRLFVLGESSAAGFPYGNNLTFSRILHGRLAEALPDRRVEVVNLGMSAISTYAMIDFMPELLRQKPDAILVYAGHNEFYGAMAVASMESLGRNPGLVRAYLKLERFKLFLALRDLIGRVRVRMILKNRKDALPEENITLMERIVADEEIPYQGPLYDKGKRQFESNLSAIVRLASKQGVLVVLSELVSNVRDQRPFASIETDTALSAKRAFEQARRLESAGRFAEAREAYLKAKDRDAVRFRASEDWNAVIRSTAAEFKCPVVPMKAAFESASPNGLVGDVLMADHLHPNADGYFLMADAFFETLKRNRMFAEKWTEGRPSAEWRKDWGMTGLDSAYAEMGIRYLKNGWPFRPKTEAHTGLAGVRPGTAAESLAVEIVSLRKKTLEVAHVHLARRYERSGEWLKAYAEYRALAAIIPHERDFEEAGLRAAAAANRPDLALSFLLFLRGFRESSSDDGRIGRLLLAMGRQEEALPYLRRAGIPLREPGNVRSTSRPAAVRSEAGDLLREARTLFERRDWKGARNALEKSLSIRESAEAHFWTGRIDLELERPDDAVPHLEAAARLSPNNPEVLVHLGLAYARSGDTGRARAAARAVEQIRPGHPGLPSLNRAIAAADGR
ncbi:MAG: GDSL-type esterase/lipase family protein [bacterium]|nr:GDSL-type esterase/lipase family protein [bacterium]